MSSVDLNVLPSGLKTILSEEGLEVRVYYLECLAQATYIISHEGSAFIVDPRRDVDAYIKDLTTYNLTLKGVLETHFHADFVSGHCELSQRTGAAIYFGPGAASRTKFSIHELKDEEMIDLSSQYALRALHTPGHTPESLVYLLVDKSSNNKPLKAFTGDTLLIGSCGRPDLVGSIGFSAHHMSAMMFNSLTTKLMFLPDDVQVFPAHGAGSPCGKNLSSDLYSTIGREKLTNPCFQFTKEDEFIKYLIKDLPESPQYFPQAAAKNWLGVQTVAAELAGIPSATATQFKNLLDTGSYTVIDTRSPREFHVCHIPGSLSFALGGAGGAVVGPEDGNFAIWVGTLVPGSDQLLVVAEPGKEGETLQRLSRIGYTNVKAVLEGGIASYKESGFPVASYDRINLRNPDTSLVSLLSSGYQLVDVRTEGEFSKNTTTTAINMPLASLPSLMARLDKSMHYVSFCVSGYRSAIATSFLQRAGFKVQDIIGGFASISVCAPIHTTTGTVCPSMQAIIDSSDILA